MNEEFQECMRGLGWDLGLPMTEKHDRAELFDTAREIWDMKEAEINRLEAKHMRIVRNLNVIEDCIRSIRKNLISP